MVSEGLSHFSTVLLTEQILGLRPRIETCKRLEEQYGEDRQADSERPLVKIDGSKPGDRTVTYDKGGWVFWMLYDHMGREAAFAGLRDFVPTSCPLGVAFRDRGLVGFHDYPISEPNSAARVLAVYASCRSLPSAHARLASGWRPCLGRTGFEPAGSLTWFLSRSGYMTHLQDKACAWPTEGMTGNHGQTTTFWVGQRRFESSARQVQVALRTSGSVSDSSKLEVKLTVSRSICASRSMAKGCSFASV